MLASAADRTELQNMRPPIRLAEISDRIQILRYLLIVGIVILHIPPHVSLQDAGSGWFDFLRSFLANSLFRTVVPTLSVISGFLLFRSGLHLDPIGLLEKKVKTLLVPLLLWNLPMVVAVFALQSAGVSGHTFRIDLRGADLIVWLNALVGLTDSPINFPLAFLRDLFVCALLSPLLGVFLRHCPWIGALIVIGNWYLNIDLELIRRNEILLMVYLGGMATTLKWPLDVLDRFAWPLIAGFLVLCAAATIAREPKFVVYLSMFGVVALWPTSALVARSQLRKPIVALSRHSFFLFVSHGPILVALWIAWKASGVDLPYGVFWAAAPVLTITVSQVSHDLLGRFAPQITSILTGARRKDLRRDEAPGPPIFPSKSGIDAAAEINRH
jgi:succinoglycan biosynthesis protein ExoH